MPPAARVTDMHVCPMVTGVVPHVGGPILPPCAPTVLIGYLPAARVTDMATCVGPPDVIVKGSPTVLINNLMAARIGDITAHGGNIILGCFTVIIGESGAGSPGTPSAALQALANAKQMALLASDVYKNSGAPLGFTRLSDDPAHLPDGLKDFRFHDPSSGFDSALYRTPSGGIVVAYRGTEGTNILREGDRKDWIANVMNALGFHSEQQDSAIELAKLVKEAYPSPPNQVMITGHSLGGGLASIGSAVTGLPGTTFNAAGVNRRALERYGSDESPINVTNYRVQGDPLTNFQEKTIAPKALGTQVDLPYVDKGGSAHSMDSVQDGLDALTKREAGI